MQLRTKKGKNQTNVSQTSKRNMKMLQVRMTRQCYC